MGKVPLILIEKIDFVLFVKQSKQTPDKLWHLYGDLIASQHSISPVSSLTTKEPIFNGHHTQAEINTMGSTVSILNSLPPLQDLLHPTPETYTQILSIWQYFAPVSSHHHKPKEHPN